MQVLLSNLIVVTVSAFAVLFALDLISTIQNCWNTAALPLQKSQLEVQQEPQQAILPDPWLLPTEPVTEVVNLSSIALPVLLLLPAAKEQPVTQAKRRPGRPKKETTAPVPTTNKRRPGRPKKVAA